MISRDELHCGDLIRIGPGAGVACKQMVARVIKVHDWNAWAGNAWLHVYELDSDGNAVEARLAYVQLAGVTMLRSAAQTAEDRRRAREAAQLARTIRETLPARRNTPPTAARVPRPRRSPEPTTRRNR